MDMKKKILIIFAVVAIFIIGMWIFFASSARADCKIKGNISASGKKIYHLPGQRFYTATIINTWAGEKWFCNEDEAKAAGWRKSER